jgi:iron complex outermembrane receptor protein
MQSISSTARCGRSPSAAFVAIVVVGFAAATGAASAAEESGGLGEVVVTAQRRAERLQDVPISVSVYDQGTMDAQGTRSIDDLGRLTPGVAFVRGTVNNNSESSDIAIRGIQSTAGASTTGVYVDDTPIQSRHLSFGTFNAYPALFDIDRVEVLRGPQGTLFGAGSEGGTVRFITPEPGLKQYSLYGRTEAGATAHGDPVYELGLAGGGPIVTDTLGFRASVSARHEGGFVDRVDWHSGQVVDKRANSNKTMTARVALKWAPTADLTITPSVYYQKRDVDDTSAYWMIGPGAPNIVDPTNGQFSSPFRTGNGIASPSSDKFTLSALKIDWTLGAVRFLSNTSYFKRNQSATTDYAQFDQAAVTDFQNPFRSAQVQAPTTWADEQENWTQEIRLESTDASARFKWTAGLFYQHAKENTVENVFDPTLLPGAYPDFWDGWVYKQDPFSGLDKQIAVFGQTDIKLADQLKLTVGLRYSKTDFTGEAFYTGLVVTGNGLVPPVSSVGSITEHPVTPKIGLNYQIDSDNLLYATAAKGYRIGGVNPAIGLFCDLTPYGLTSVPPGYSSDSLWSYELGTKNTLADRHVLLNASVYLIKWKNIQQNVGLPCGFQFTANLGEAKSTGFDVQAQFRLTDAVSLGATFGYTDAKYTQTVFATAAAASAPGALAIVSSDDHLPGSPWTLAVFGTVNFHVFDRDGYARLDYQYGAQQTDLTAAQNPANGGDPTFVPNVPSQAYASVRTGVKANNFDVSLFVQNLFDSRPKLSVAADGPLGSPLYQVNTWRPRTIGVTATYRY